MLPMKDSYIPNRKMNILYLCFRYCKIFAIYHFICVKFRKKPFLVLISSYECVTFLCYTFLRCRITLNMFLIWLYTLLTLEWYIGGILNPFIIHQLIACCLSIHFTETNACRNILQEELYSYSLALLANTVHTCLLTNNL